MDIKHYIGEVGLSMILDLKIDISDATTVKILVKEPPDGTEVEWAAIKHTIDGATNYLLFVSLADTFSNDGIYKLQGYAKSDTFERWGETVSFPIYKKYT